MAINRKTPDRPIRDLALEIWLSGVKAVESRRLVSDSIQVDSDSVDICGERIPLATDSRICVVGAGKAGAGMVQGLEDAFAGTEFDQQVSGWVNIPADCMTETRRVHLHAARPAGLNEPTEEGVEGAARILECVESLTDNDVCIVLLSGGGSALLPAPIDGVTLEQKQALTRHLMHSGATIGQMNAIRKRISRIKGGGLAAASRAGHNHALIISDVIGDPLDVIASGPTVDDTVDDETINSLIDQFQLENVVDGLRDLVLNEGESRTETRSAAFSNHIIGSNQIALDAAAATARHLGFEIVSLGSANEGIAAEIGVELAEQMLARSRKCESPVCILSGGEPVVNLAPTNRKRRGGRNQELVLAAAQRFLAEDSLPGCLLSGGTDGEDGPTDAAGAVIDTDSVQALREKQIDINDCLSINNSYEALEQIGSLIIMGPTHTNVMDLRVALIWPQECS